MNNPETAHGAPERDAAPRLDFVRSGLFFGAGWITLTACVAEWLLARHTAAGRAAMLVWLPAAIAGYALIICWCKRRRTVTPADRTLLDAWLYAPAIASYVAIRTYSTGLPPAGFLVLGLSISTALTAEQFRRRDTNRSNQGGSLVALGMTSLAGTFLAAQIFVAAAEEEPLARFLCTLAALVVLLFGTGGVLRHNERRHV